MPNDTALRDKLARLVDLGYLTMFVALRFRCRVAWPSGGVGRRPTLPRPAPSATLGAMRFQAHELATIERAVNAFMQRRRPPLEIRAELDIEHRIEGQSLEIFERRPAWRGAPGETIELRVAKATYVRSRDRWRVYWQRADLHWHRYDPTPEVRTVEEFLDLVDEDRYCCFFG